MLYYKFEILRVLGWLDHFFEIGDEVKLALGPDRLAGNLPDDTCKAHYAEILQKNSCLQTKSQDGFYATVIQDTSGFGETKLTCDAKIGQDSTLAHQHAISVKSKCLE